MTRRTGVTTAGHGDGEKHRSPRSTIRHGIPRWMRPGTVPSRGTPPEPEVPDPETDGRSAAGTRQSPQHEEDQ